VAFDYERLRRFKSPEEDERPRGVPDPVRQARLSALVVAALKAAHLPPEARRLFKRKRVSWRTVRRLTQDVLSLPWRIEDARRESARLSATAFCGCCNRETIDDE